MAEEVARIVDVPLVRLVRYEQEGSVAHLIGGWGKSVDPIAIGTRWLLDGPGVLTSVWQSCRPARLDDYTRVPGHPAAVVRQAGMRSAVASPIVVEGRLWGAIAVLSPRLEPLPDGTEARLADFTELVATAIANAQSRAELAASEERARHLATEQAALRRVATLVARESLPRQLFAAVAEEVGRVLNAPIVRLLRYEPDGSAVEIVSHWSEEVIPVPIGTRMLLDGPSHLASVWETGHPARFDEPTDVPGQVAGVMRQMGLRSGVASPIVVEGRIWGAMGVASPDRLPEDIESRLTDFTELVATAIANAEGRAELAASRARVIAAADESARRIERDLHDGAQQQLVTLAIALRATGERVPPGLDELREEVARVVDGLTATLDELREISRGIHPAILTEGGLAPALKALARHSPIPVEIDVDCERRLDGALEVAAYYTASEALTNAAKHAGASRVKITLRVDDGALYLSIRDDGAGGADPSRGSGLIGLRDRVEALGGRIEVASPHGSGTRVLVEIPRPRDPADVEGSVEGRQAAARRRRDHSLGDLEGELGGTAAADEVSDLVPVDIVG